MNKCTIKFKTTHRCIFIETCYSTANHWSLNEKYNLINFPSNSKSLLEQQNDVMDKPDQYNFHVTKLDI